MKDIRLFQPISSWKPLHFSPSFCYHSSTQHQTLQQQDGNFLFDFLPWALFLSIHFSTLIIFKMWTMHSKMFYFTSRRNYYNCYLYLSEKKFLIKFYNYLTSGIDIGAYDQSFIRMLRIQRQDCGFNKKQLVVASKLIYLLSICWDMWQLAYGWLSGFIIYLTKV